MDLVNGILVREKWPDDIPGEILFFPEMGKDDIKYTDEGRAHPIGINECHKYYLWQWDDFRDTYSCNFRLPIPGRVIEDIWLEV